MKTFARSCLDQTAQRPPRPMRRLPWLAILSASAWLTAFSPSAKAAAVACGAHFTCEWVTDKKDEGEFKISSKAAIGGAFNALADPAFPNNFTGNFWELKFTTFTEAINPLTGALVSTKGTFQHIKPADARDAEKGGIYNFDLLIKFGQDEVRDPPGKQNWKLIEHPINPPIDIHNDAFASILSGTPVAGTQNYGTYTFNIKGKHTVDPFFHDEFPTPVPEPDSPLLLIAGLLVLGAGPVRARVFKQRPGSR